MALSLFLEFAQAVINNANNTSLTPLAHQLGCVANIMAKPQKVIIKYQVNNIYLITSLKVKAQYPQQGRQLI